MPVSLTNPLSLKNRRLVSGGLLALTLLAPAAALAGTALSFPVTMSEAVVVTGTPRLAIDVGGVTRYATYASGSGTNTLTFTYNTQAGDVDLNGIAVSSPIDLNGGTLKDLGGNAVSPLTFTAPNTANVKIDHPSLAMDFIGNDYLVSGTHYASLASFIAATGGAHSRASTATYFDASGNLQTAASNVPRLDYDPVTLVAKGLLLEEARTNYVQNSQFSGVTTGGPYTSSTVLGSHWQPLGAGNFVTGSITITGTGTANGISYLDLRFQGTNSSGTNGYLTFNTIAADKFAIVTGDKTVTSAWLGVTSYSSVAGTCSILLQSRSSDSGGGYAGGTSITLSSLSPWQKRETPVLTHGATGVKADGWIFLTATNGATCDVTVRFGGLQVEKAGYVSSYIPTTSGTATRAQDLLSIPTGGWFNLNTSTLIGQGSVFGLTSGGTFQFGLGTNNQNYVGFPYNTTTGFGGASYYRSAGAGPIINPGPLSYNTTYKSGYAFSTVAGTSTYSISGALSGTGSSVAAMASASSLTIGYAPFASSALPGYVRSIRYYPSRVADAQLQLLTQ